MCVQAVGNERKEGHSVGFMAVNGPYYLASKLEHEDQSHNPPSGVTRTPPRVYSTHLEVPRMCSEPGDVDKPGFIARSGYETCTRQAVLSLGRRWSLHDLVKPSVATDSVRLQGRLSSSWRSRNICSFV